MSLVLSTSTKVVVTMLCQQC